MKQNKQESPDSDQQNYSNQFQSKIESGKAPQMDSHLPGLEDISEISIKNSNSDNNNDIPSGTNFPNPNLPTLIPKKDSSNGQERLDNLQNDNLNQMKPFLQLNDKEPLSIHVKSRNKRKIKKTKVNLDPSMNTFLEDIRQKDGNSFFQDSLNKKDFSDNKMEDIYKMANPRKNPILETNNLNSFSFRGSAVSNSKDFNNSLFRKKKQEGRFTEVMQLPNDNILANDTSINHGLPPIPTLGVHFQPSLSKNNLPSFHMDRSFNIPRHVNPAGSNQDFLSNMDQSFQKVNESGFNDMLGHNASNNVLGDQSILEKLNNSFKEYPNPQNISLNYDKNMNRLDRMDNSFNLSMHKPSLGHYHMALNDTLNQSAQFKMRNSSRNNLDNSYHHYIGDQKGNVLTGGFPNKEMDTSEIKNDPNTSFDQNTQNILSMLDKVNPTQPIPEKFEEELDSFGKINENKEGSLENKLPEKFFMDPESRDKKEPQINAKVQRIENNDLDLENMSESSLQEKNLKNSDIMNYIIKNYSAQCINNVVSAKCAKYMKKKPDIFEMINSVISKNKKWKRILDIVQKELSKNDGSSDSDNMKSTFSITTEQKQNDKKIVNKININFNTEVKYEGVPWKLAKYLGRKRRRRGRKRNCRKAKETEDRLGIGKIKRKAIQGYSEKFSSSNESHSSGQVINCKRVKQDISSKSDGKMMASFISDNKNKGINFFDTVMKQPPKSDIGDLSEGPEEVVVVKKIEKKDGLLNKRGYVKRKRGRPKGSKNSKTSSVTSKALKRKSYRRRGRKRSLKERMKNIILNDGESFGLNSDMDSKSVVRSRRSGRRRKKSDFSKNYDDDSFNGLRGNKKKIFEILKVTFTEMSINSQSHADFLNSNLDEAKVLRVILEKKFEIKDKIQVEKLRMKKEKKRNEEINKFVVKRCMKNLMKKNRDKSINKTDDVSGPITPELKKQNRNSEIEYSQNQIKTMKNQHEMVSVTSIFPKESHKLLEKDIGSLSNISMQQEHNSTLERNITFRPPSSKLLSNPRNNLMSQSEFPNLNELNDEALPESSAKELSFNKGVFGPKKFEVAQNKNNNFLDSLKENTINVQRNHILGDIEKKEEPKENTKMLAHSKLLSEHQFYLKYFNKSSIEQKIPLAKYYLPNTKLANNANRENKGNKQAQSYKTINIKYIRLILHSKYFSDSIKNFLEDVFEFEYRETRIQKLRLLAKSINNPKYIKSVKLPWTMHEIMEAKSTFMKLIETTEKEIYGVSKKKGNQGSKKKKKNEVIVVRESRMTRSRTKRRKQSNKDNNNEDNFQACFADSHKSNKFLGS
jgi:hypothetical protein